MSKTRGRNVRRKERKTRKWKMGRGRETQGDGKKTEENKGKKNEVEKDEEKGKERKTQRQSKVRRR